uniref:Uncharacterized protein n=1 Tax=Anguilla anguilla TaxID=7936 RepID=A0A0E9UDC7_ANGAN
MEHGDVLLGSVTLNWSSSLNGVEIWDGVLTDGVDWEPSEGEAKAA